MKGWPRSTGVMSIRHVVALGGSLLRPEEAAQRENWMARLRQLAVHLEGNGRKLALVVGGGLPAREGIQLAAPMISSPHRLDEIGIAATRLNAPFSNKFLLRLDVMSPLAFLTRLMMLGY